MPGARRTPLPALGLWAAAFCFYAGGAWLLSRSRDPAARSRGQGRGTGRWTLGTVWAVAVVGRLSLLALDPHFSDDLWRYLWDGHVQLHGVNPYLHPPADEALAPLRASWHALINHPTVSTIYPPGAQLGFAALAAIGARVVVFKLAWIAADLAAGWILGRIAHQRGLDPAPVLLLYLWCPLLVVEVAWSGHLAPLGLLPMMAAVWFAEKGGADRDGGGEWWAGGLLGLASAVKFAPAAGLPALVRRHGWRGLTGFILITGLVVAPYVDAGAQLWAGLAEYVERWSFHPGPFRLLELPLGTGLAKAAGAAAVVGLALRGAAERWTLERALFWTVGAGLLLTPTLHPWYLLWILPFAALRRRPGWILFTGTAFLSYAHLDEFARTGTWPQPLWLTLLIWVPPLAVMGWTTLATSAGGRVDPGTSGN